jgi:hypothetical protein
VGSVYPVANEGFGVTSRRLGEPPEEGTHVDLVYSLSADRYGPSENGGALQLAVLDMAESE